MRRILLGGLAATALALSLPMVALAQHHGHRGSHHVAKAHLRHFGATISAATSSTTTTPTTTVTAPTQSAGTVVSFTNGVLVLKLNDNSTVSGVVGPGTRIDCVSATAPTSGQDQGSQSGDDDADEGPTGSTGSTGTTGSTDSTGSTGSQSGGGRRDDGRQGGSDGGTDGGGNNGGGEGDGGQSADQGGNQGGDQVASCDSSVLVPNAMIIEAELRLGAGGSQFAMLVVSQ
jgi:hypothetical protein